MGDVPEQNGAYNIASVIKKRNIMERKERTMFDRPTIELYEIIGIINAAWERSFARVGSNKVAITKRGWFPYNRQIMTLPQIRSSITKEEEDLELLPTSSIILPIQARESIINLSNSEPSIDPTYISIPIHASTPNFTFDIAAWFLDNMFKDQNLNTARVRIKKNREECKSLKEKLIKSKKITAGCLFKAGSCRIGKNFLIYTKSER